MKKYLLGIVALVLAIGFSAFTTNKAIKSTKNITSLYWYEVVAGLTSGPWVFHDTKAVVIGLQDCQDHPMRPICLFGSTDNGLDGASVAGYDAAHSILESN
jgi:hypothetical protein